MAIEDNIPTQINIPGSLTGRHESSLIAPLSFSSFTTNMKSDIAPMSTLSFTTKFKSDIAPIPFANFNTAMKSDIAPIAVSQFDPNLKSFIAPQLSILGANNTTSTTAPINSTLGANNTTSATAPQNSVLGANNIASTTAPQNSVLGANNTDSSIAPITSTLTGRFDTSDIAPIVSQLQGRFESSETAPIISTLTGRFESSATAPVISVLTGRHESSDTAPLTSVLTGRFESSDTAPIISTLEGRHESSNIDDAATQLSGRHESSNIDDAATQLEGRHESSGIDDAATTLSGRHDSSNIAPIISTLTGRHETSNIDTAFSTDRIDTIFGAGGQDLNDQINEGVNFVDIPNLAAEGFTPKFDTGDASKFQGISGQEYNYPDPFGLGQGLIGNSLFTNPYPTPYTTPLFPDGFVENQPIEESQFSLESFAGGGKIGLGTEGFKHAIFGGVQGQVPIMGNNPTGLGQFTEGGATSGDIGIVDAFDDTTSGAKGFTPNMFDLGLPKTQFNGVAGTPGTLTYAYPTDVGPAGAGRLMYDTPFSDAGNPYGGEYTAALTKQIPANPLITINKDVGTDQVDFDFYKAAPDRLQFHEGNKYQDSLGNFDATIELNGMHPKSILADFAAREHSPSPLDSISVLIPGNTGPTGESDVTANYKIVEGYPNYETHNLSYSAAEVSNQRVGFERNELFERSYDPSLDGTYGHDLSFGGTGDDPKGLKSYTEPHIIRDIGQKWNGSTDESMPFDEGAFRGGFVTLGNRALLDVQRNAKQIIENPIKGLLWGLKQIGLQASNPKVETEVQPFLGIRRPTRLFNLGIGYLANLLTGPFGIKLYRHGLLNGFGSDKGLYEAAVTAHNAPDRYDTPGKYPDKGGGNRLIGLKEDLLISDTGGSVGGLLGGLLGQTGVEIKPLSDSAFFNGPKSLYGIGGTTIRRYDNSHVHKLGGELALSDDKNTGGGDSNLLAKYATMTYGDLQDAADDRSNSFHDFRHTVYSNAPTGEDGFIGGALDIEDYDSANREVLFGYSKYSNERDRNNFEDDLDLTDPWNDPDLMDDQIDTGVQDAVDTIGNTRDMIKLVVEDVQTGKYVRFRSYVSAMTDTITPTWNPQKYVGRPDPVYNYQQAEREFSFTLMFATLSRKGLKGMYKKVNFLYGLCYPHITSGTQTTQALAGPYVRLTLGDWMKDAPGFFSAMTTTIDQNYPWEINLENDDEAVAQLPHMLSVSLTYKVIGDGPHTSAVTNPDFEDIAGRHIGGGLNKESARGTFHEGLIVE